MITEKRFSLSHQSFWQRTLPMAISYVRRRNLGIERFETPLESSLVEERGVINQAAFEIFKVGHEQSLAVREVPEPVVEECVASAVQFISRFRARSRVVARPYAKGVGEAVELASRLECFVRREAPRGVVVSPSFAGCGWLDQCNGDLLLDGALVEVKAGASQFRSRDIRQVLVYAALNSISREHEIDEIYLVNPRLGVYLREGLEELCQEMAGCSSVEVLAEIVSYMLEPSWRDEAV